VSRLMVGHKFGEFSLTRKYPNHPDPIDPHQQRLAAAKPKPAPAKAKE